MRKSFAILAAALCISGTAWAGKAPQVNVPGLPCDQYTKIMDGKPTAQHELVQWFVVGFRLGVEVQQNGGAGDQIGAEQFFNLIGEYCIANPRETLGHAMRVAHDVMVVAAGPKT